MQAMESKLREYLKRTTAFGQVEVSEIVELTDGKSNNHANYKIITNGGTFVARVTKPGEMISYSNLADEFTILKLVEKHDVGPKAVAIDLEHFDSPIMFEEYFTGTQYGNLTKAEDEMFEAFIDLMVRVSEVKLTQADFPFKQVFTTYESNFRGWEYRLGEIEQRLGGVNSLTETCREVARNARVHLEKVDSILRTTQPEFIYNDVHPGNTFWLPDSKQAKFIDWQKVTLGDPSFMIALFARRCAKMWSTKEDVFKTRVLGAYTAKKKIPQFEILFYARILERAVSDMIWVPWYELRSGRPVDPGRIEESKYLQEAKSIMATMK